MGNTHGVFTFDGANKRITISTGTVAFNASDAYSRWKDWIQEDPARLQYLPAYDTSVGGNDLGGGIEVGQYYFIQNGWVIRPQEADHTLNVTGNLFPSPADAAIYTSTAGDFQVVIGTRTSSLTQNVTMKDKLKKIQLSIDILD